MVIEKSTILSFNTSINSILVSLQTLQTGAENIQSNINKYSDQIILDGVDGESGQGVVDSVGLHLTHSLQPAHLLLDVHVVESSVNNVNAEIRR